MSEQKPEIAKELTVDKWSAVTQVQLNLAIPMERIIINGPAFGFPEIKTVKQLLEQFILDRVALKKVVITSNLGQSTHKPDEMNVDPK